MSENQSPQIASDSANQTAQDSVDSARTPKEKVAASSPASDTSAGSESDTSAGSEPIEEWTPANLPGTVGVRAANDSSTRTGTSTNAIREAELLTLIHDLNECNDVLLSRVSDLETALNDAHQNAQNEAQNTQAAKAQMAERLSVVQASAQQTSQHAQQQVANVVDQLETAEQALQRQQLINETLNSELGNAQERVGQLEHECAMSSQRHAEEAQARVKADNTIRDLRSRLQRQQRYTLQFKAALERSLTVTARSAKTQPISAPALSSTVPMPPGMAPGMAESTHRPTAFSSFQDGDRAHDDSSSNHSAVSMPKAQRIMPWAGVVSAPFDGLDPHLENLIRDAGKTNREPDRRDLERDPERDPEHDPERYSEQYSEQYLEKLAKSLQPNVSEAMAENSEAIADPEAELWRDIERVLEQTAEESVTADKSESVSQPSPATNGVDIDVTTVDTDKAKRIDVDEAAKATSAEAATDNKTVGPNATELNATELNATEPRLNWQRSATPTSAVLTSAVLTSAAQPSAAQPSAAQPSVAQPSVASPENTQPSAQPAAQAQSELKSIVIDPYTAPAGQRPAAEVSFTEPSHWGQPLTEKVKAVADDSSTVNPLRPQRKIGSMSAVQLPTFEKAKVASFKR